MAKLAGEVIQANEPEIISKLVAGVIGDQDENYVSGTTARRDVHTKSNKDTCIAIMEDARQAQGAVLPIINDALKQGAFSAARALLHDVVELGDAEVTASATLLLEALKKIQSAAHEAWKLARSLENAGEKAWHEADQAEKAQAAAPAGDAATS